MKIFFSIKNIENKKNEHVWYLQQLVMKYF